MTEALQLSWNYHSIAFGKFLNNIHLKESYSDGIIMCEDNIYPIHSFVLSTYSDYFKNIFDHCNKLCTKHPFIAVNNIGSVQLEAILNYMYKGEVCVSKEMVPSLIKSAELLKIKGLGTGKDDFGTLYNDNPSAKSSIDCSLNNGEEISVNKEEYTSNISSVNNNEGDSISNISSVNNEEELSNNSFMNNEDEISNICFMSNEDEIEKSVNQTDKIKSNSIFSKKLSMNIDDPLEIELSGRPNFEDTIIKTEELETCDKISDNNMHSCSDTAQQDVYSVVRFIGNKVTKYAAVQTSTINKDTMTWEYPRNLEGSININCKKLNSMNLKYGIEILKTNLNREKAKMYAEQYREKGNSTGSQSSSHNLLTKNEKDLHINKKRKLDAGSSSENDEDRLFSEHSSHSDTDDIIAKKKLKKTSSRSRRIKGVVISSEENDQQILLPLANKVKRRKNSMYSQMNRDNEPGETNIKSVLATDSGNRDSTVNVVGEINLQEALSEMRKEIIWENKKELSLLADNNVKLTELLSAHTKLHTTSTCLPIELAAKIPLNTVEKFYDFSTEMQTVELRQLMVSYLSSRGSGSIEETILIMMDCMLTKSMAQKTNWTGRPFARNMPDKVKLETSFISGLLNDALVLKGFITTGKGEIKNGVIRWQRKRSDALNKSRKESLDVFTI